MSVDPLAGKYAGLSPYNYCKNSPLRLTDPDGRNPWDIVKDFTDAVTQDLSGRDYNNASDIDDKGDYSAGRTLGHLFAGIFGAAETAFGSLEATVGGISTVTSAGTMSPVSIPVALGGAVLAGHGVSTMKNASSNLINENKSNGSNNYRESNKGGKEHTKNARPSTKQKHEDGMAKKKKDKFGGEKGDVRRRRYK